jgi:protein-S-isoprenylcysteine O-methyltransferase Ste14
MSNSELGSTSQGGESIRELIRGILSDIRMLIREEVALARSEIREQVGRARTAALSFGIAIGALAFGATFLLIALAVGIADMLGWPVWAGFLSLAVLLCIVAFATLTMGRRQLRSVHAVPTETVATLKENSEWIAKRLSSMRK